MSACRFCRRRFPICAPILLATADEAQLVLSGFLVMLGLGQLGAGSVSDSVGRRPVMMFGALLFAVSGIGALLAPNVWVLIVMRILQGVGAAACMAMGRVIVNDGFSREEAGRQLSTITMFQAVVPILGFAFGGMLADFVGWRGAIAVMVATAAVVLLRDDLPASRNAAGKIAANAGRKDDRRLCSSPRTPKFITNAGAAALLTAAFFAMGGFMPYHFKSLGASAFEFGLYFSITSVGYMAGNSINRSLGPRMGLDRAAFTGALISVVTMSGLTLAGYAEMAVQPVISFFLFFYGFSNGLVIANTIIAAVRAAGPHSGAATGLCGALQMGFSAVLGSLIIALGGDSNFKLAISICWLMSVFGLASAYLALERAPRRPEG